LCNQCRKTDLRLVTTPSNDYLLHGAIVKETAWVVNPREKSGCDSKCFDAPFVGVCGRYHPSRSRQNSREQIVAVFRPSAAFVHGVFLNGLLWPHVIDRVADTRRCIEGMIGQPPILVPRSLSCEHSHCSIASKRTRCSATGRCRMLDRWLAGLRVASSSRARQID